MLKFKKSSNQSFFTVGNLECEYNSTISAKTLPKIRVLKACRPVNPSPTTVPRKTYETVTQLEHVINWNRQRPFTFGRPTEKVPVVGPILRNVNVNVTVELPNINMKESKREDGLKFTLSVYAVIVIAVASVIVIIVIAVVIIFKRCHGRRRSLRPDYESDDECDTPRESTEMCTFFGSISSADRNRPVIEVHRHSIHLDTLDELPPAYRAWNENNTHPITTHIDLSYKSRKKSLGIFC